MTASEDFELASTATLDGDGEKVHDHFFGQSSAAQDSEKGVTIKPIIRLSSA
jgi:hypothetical protein